MNIEDDFFVIRDMDQLPQGLRDEYLLKRQFLSDLIKQNQFLQDEIKLVSEDLKKTKSELDKDYRFSKKLKYFSIAYGVFVVLSTLVVLFLVLRGLL